MAASASGRRPGWLDDLHRVDAAVYAAIAATPTPTLDTGLRRLSDAADHSKLSIAAAALLSVAGGSAGRRGAATGLASVGVTSAAVNLLLKPLAVRRRPDREADRVPFARHVRMPTSGSWPSGHSAAAFAFATGVGHELPAAGVPLRLLATLVAYSRVHTGVHYPGDTIAGSVIGGALAQVTARLLERHGR
jgi:membrane-associated phospholipid phosphatase